MTPDLSICPHCGNDHLYQLGDGRNKCSACQRKFSASRRRSRLTSDAMAAIVTGFADGCPASEITKTSGLNLKTVQLYYSRIRELIAEEREKYLFEQYGGGEVSPEIFLDSDLGEQWRNAIFIGCLVDQENEMDLLFANDKTADNTANLESAAVAGWLVAADRHALENLDLDRIFCLPGKSAKERARTFWKNTKHRLAAYCGGFKKNFRLYLREMEFRNNIKSPAAAREQIEKLLDQSTTKPTGDEDA